MCSEMLMQQFTISIRRDCLHLVFVYCSFRKQRVNKCIQRNCPNAMPIDLTHVCILVSQSIIFRFTGYSIFESSKGDIYIYIFGRWVYCNMNSVYNCQTMNFRLAFVNDENELERERHWSLFSRTSVMHDVPALAVHSTNCF